MVSRHFGAPPDAREWSGGAGRPGRGRHGRELDGIDVLILALVFYSVSQDVSPVLSPYYFLQPHVGLSLSNNKKKTLLEKQNGN